MGLGLPLASLLHDLQIPHVARTSTQLRPHGKHRQASSGIKPANVSGVRQMVAGSRRARWSHLQMLTHAMHKTWLHGVTTGVLLSHDFKQTGHIPTAQPRAALTPSSSSLQKKLPRRRPADRQRICSRRSGLAGIRGVNNDNQAAYCRML